MGSENRALPVPPARVGGGGSSESARPRRAERPRTVRPDMSSGAGRREHGRNGRARRSRPDRRDARSPASCGTASRASANPPAGRTRAARFDRARPRSCPGRWRSRPRRGGRFGPRQPFGRSRAPRCGPARRGSPRGRRRAAPRLRRSRVPRARRAPRAVSAVPTRAPAGRQSVAAPSMCAEPTGAAVRARSPPSRRRAHDRRAAARARARGTAENAARPRRGRRRRCQALRVRRARPRARAATSARGREPTKARRRRARAPLTPLDAARAAGAVVLREEPQRPRLLGAAVPVHVTVSLWWALVLARILPRGREVALGALAGLGIAAFDLGVVGRRFPRFRALALVPQLADHALYGATVGYVLARRRR